jgi:hypothetical protein
MSYFFASPITDSQEAGYRRDPWRAHTSAIEALRPAGIEPPAEWTALLARYTAFIELGDHATDRLADELLHPRGGDITSLRSAALAEEIARTGDDVAVNTRVQTAVLAELLALYEPAAKQNYKIAAAVYDSAAKRFVDCARTVNIEADGEALVTANSAAREAWLNAPAAAADLEQSLHPLYAAAALAGAPDDVAFITGATDTSTAEIQIGLACDPGKAHRRRTWEAWASKKGRCGRWSALHALNVRIRAASDPIGVTPYGRPNAHITVANPGGRLENWDPHDGDLPRGWRPVQTGWYGEQKSTTAIP